MPNSKNESPDANERLQQMPRGRNFPRLNTHEDWGYGRWSFIIQTIGMIDLAGKLFERLILNRMEKVWEEEDEKGISAAQFSFHKGLSIDHALKKVEEEIWNRESVLNLLWICI